MKKKISAWAAIEISGKVRFVFEDKDKRRKITINSNMVVDSGLALLAKAIAFTNPVELIIGNPYIALGEIIIGGVVSNPASTDVLLNAELPNINVPRVEVTAANITRQNNVVIFEATFSLDQGNPTAGNELCEAGLFWDNATATRETGTLVARVLIQPRKVKTVYQTLTVTWYISIRRKPISRAVVDYP